MGFLSRLFSSKDESKGEYSDPHGIYFYVECERCYTVVRLRADKRHDFNRESDGYVWHKTVVDSRCFQPMQTVVHLDSKFNITNADIDNGKYVSEEVYNAFINPPPSGSESDAEPEPGEEQS